MNRIILIALSGLLLVGCSAKAAEEGEATPIQNVTPKVEVSGDKLDFELDDGDIWGDLFAEEPEPAPEPIPEEVKLPNMGMYLEDD